MLANHSQQDIPRLKVILIFKKEYPMPLTLPRTASSLIALGLGLALALPAAARDEAAITQTDDIRILDILTVIGTAGGKQNVGGSIDFLDSEDLDKQGHSDILRILRVVPGVNIQEEEGYGLRPNIGLRGSGSDRNSRIVILEDGIPIAPAVYAAPSAYYFPASVRINAVEVTKGPSVIQYGPRTTGGAIHLFSTPIPTETRGKAEILWGDFGRQRLHANFGTRQALTGNVDLGLLIETVQDEADGFLERDSTGPDTGFDLSDYVVKAGLYGDDAALPWSLELKYQTKSEVSNQTYLGLIDEDFNANAFRLYDAARNDQMVNDNELLQLTGQIDLNSNTAVTIVAYSNEVARNWYKLQGVNALGGGASGDVGLSSILENPLIFAAELDLLRGISSLNGSLVLRANNRKYYSRGLSGTLDTELTLAGLTHNFNLGLRYHEDEEDRFQHEDAFRLQGGVLQLTTAGGAGSQTNRVTEAEALSFFVLDRIELTQRLQITGGLRFEDFEITRFDFSTSDPTRSTGSTRERSEDDQIILPSLSAVYRLTDSVDLFGGVHRGVSPVGPTDTDAKSEGAWQYEFGTRYTEGDLALEGVAFFNDFSNLLGECTNSSGGDCEPGDAFNGDAVEVYGLELTARWDAAETLNLSGLSVPLSLAYSYTDTEFKTSFDSNFFGNVTAGDELIYVPKHQVTLAAGLVGNKWDVYALLNYVGKARTEPGQGPIPAGQDIDRRTIVDISASYEIADGIRLKAKAENLFDETYIASRRPSGLRPGKPREILFGVEVTF